MKTTVAITGMGLVTPYGVGNDCFREALERGDEAIRPLTLFESPLDKPVMAVEVPDFDPKPILGKKGLRNFDRMTLMLLTAGELLHRDMGFENIDTRRDLYPDERISLVLGTMGSLKSILDFDLETVREPQSVRPGFFPNTVFCAAASYAAIRFSIKESCVTVTNDEPSSLNAFSYGIDHLLSGRVDMAIVGAAEELSAIYMMASLRVAQTHDYLMPILAEGAQIFALETFASAAARGAKPLGEVLGWATCFCPDKQRAHDFNMTRILEWVGAEDFNAIEHIYSCHKDIDEQIGSLSKARLHKLYNKFGYCCSMSGSMAVTTALADKSIPKGALILTNNMADSGSAASMLIRRLAD
jgi:3-oxoacyl-[acyl-carrier-protein] synthase II